MSNLEQILEDPQLDRAIRFVYQTGTLDARRVDAWLQDQATTKVTTAAMLQQVIDAARGESRRLIDQADTAEKRRDILPKIEALNGRAENAAALLANLAGEEPDYGE